MLDELDLKIISILEQNGRATYTQMAETLGITDNTVAKRVEALLGSQAITINALPELQRMGYSAQAMVAMNVTTDRIDALVISLLKYPNIYIFKTIGCYNLVVIISFPGWDEIMQFLKTELTDKNEILKMEVCFVKQAFRLPFKLPDESDRNPAPVNVDEVDKKIIHELGLNGRYTARHISALLDISVTSANQRINRLLANQVITVRAIRNPAQFGEKLEALIFLKSTTGHIEKIISNLESVPEVRGILKFTGGFDFYARLATNNCQDLFDIVKNKFGIISGVSKIEVLVIAKKLPDMSRILLL
jgi:DNA-binding Lrp family transcriptional regulator